MTTNSKPTTIRNWNDKEYTLNDILELCDQSDKAEIDFCDVIDGDLATSTTIIRGLVHKVILLEAQLRVKNEK